MFKVFIIDDNEKLCKSVARFNDGVFAVDYRCEIDLADTETIKSQIIEQGYDVVIFDLEIGDVNGLDLYNAMSPLEDIIVIFLSGTSTVDVRIKSLKAGVDDFLQKPIDLLELQVKLEKALAHKSELRVEHYGDYVIDNELQIVTLNGKVVSLPPLSEKLLKYMLRNQNRDLPREELLKNVWHYHDENGNRIIDTNINIIRTATRDSNILTVRGVGYRYEKVR